MFSVNEIKLDIPNVKLKTIKLKRVGKRADFEEESWPLYIFKRLYLDTSK